MPQYLAIEWDPKEARVAVARTRGASVTIEHAFSVELGGTEAAAANVGRAVAAELRARNVGRLEALVAVGRANIELRQMSLPPAPPEELPELVRFQALRQFTTIGGDWPLDFAPLDSEGSESLSVLAAAISPEQVTQIKATCAAAELTPKRLVLRPFAAASLLRRHDRDVAQPCRLMVDLLTDEADLTVLDGKHVLLMRTVRLASSDEVAVLAKSLLGEIRRTIAASTNQLHGRRVEKIILCGEGRDQATIKLLVEQELSLQVEVFSPFDDLTLATELQKNRPQHSGRFAPLLGMLVDEACGAAHAIDFLHPRKKPEVVNTRRRNLLIGATLGAMALAAVLLVMIQLESLDSEMTRLRSKNGGMKSKVAVAVKQKQATAAVQEFVDSDINWLNELQNLSRQLPPPEDILITQLSAGTRVPRGGEIAIEGYTREPALITEIQQRLRVDNRKVISKGGQDDIRREKDKYRWRFDETVIIEPGETAVPAPNSPAPNSPAVSPSVPKPTETGPTAANTKADGQSKSGSSVR